jgi:hypothetical protein
MVREDLLIDDAGCVRARMGAVRTHTVDGGGIR